MFCLVTSLLFFTYKTGFFSFRETVYKNFNSTNIILVDLAQQSLITDFIFWLGLSDFDSSHYMPRLSILSRSFTKTIKQPRAKKETHEESAMYFSPNLIHGLTYLGEDVII